MTQPIFPNAEEMDAIARLFPLAARRKVARMTFPRRASGQRPTGDALDAGRRAKHCGCVNDALLVASKRVTTRLLDNYGFPLPNTIFDALGAAKVADSVEKSAILRLMALNDEGHLATTAAVRRALLRPGE